MSRESLTLQLLSQGAARSQKAMDRICGGEVGPLCGWSPWVGLMDLPRLRTSCGNADI